MTLDELERIEAIFRNPPSTGVLAEHGLALCAALRPYADAPVSPVPLDLAVKEALVMPESFSAVAVEALGEVSHDANPELDAVPDMGEADPTPPHSPKAKKGKR